MGLSADGPIRSSKRFVCVRSDSGGKMLALLINSDKKLYLTSVNRYLLS